ncbi:MAG: hypothetical protein FWF69_04305 [Firmicutes bacterium]|nr:hypothetical protein [Bacillota bacterium]
MKKATHIGDFKKYPFLMVFLVLIAFCAYFYVARNNMDETLLKEMIADRRVAIDTICDTINRFVEADNDWATYDYVTILSGVVAELDAARGVYAELFDTDMHNLSKRWQAFVEDAAFEAEDYPALLQTMRENERGEVTIWFDKPDTPSHDIHIYYRWVPTNKALEGRLLIVLGVSKYAINHNISSWITYGAAALIAVTAVLMLGAVMLLCRLGYIYQQRGGADKWRRKIFS